MIFRLVVLGLVLTIVAFLEAADVPRGSACVFKPGSRTCKSFSECEPNQTCADPRKGHSAPGTCLPVCGGFAGISCKNSATRCCYFHEDLRQYRTAPPPFISDAQGICLNK